MTVNQFDPKQTTTMDTPKRVIEEQAIIVRENQSASQTIQSNNRIGFVSLGWLK